MTLSNEDTIARFAIVTTRAMELRKLVEKLYGARHSPMFDDDVGNNALGGHSYAAVPAVIKMAGLDYFREQMWSSVLRLIPSDPKLVAETRERILFKMEGLIA